MSTFVVSLFLPYTIDFHDLPTEARNTPTNHGLGLQDGAADGQTTASLFTPQNPPKTPQAIDQLGFFVQHPPTPATHFPKPHDPRSLVRSDSHYADWGSTRLFFNQPRSRAGPLPPDTILQYQRALEQQQHLQQQQQQQQDRQRKALADTRQQQSHGAGHTPRRRRSPRSSGSRPSPSESGDSESWQAEWTVEPAVEGNGGLANAVRAASNAGTIGDFFWVGTVGFPTDALGKGMKDDIHDRLESDYNALAVYVSDSDFDGHYTHYCKTILWPVFHYQIPDHPKSKAYEDHSWIYYVHLNRAFADKVIQSYKRGDTIWIHDYHLLLVPGMIRKALPEAKIGFFLHTAFPSSEVLRCLSVRKELLEGMLGANLIAFQSREYAHHFLQTCSRLLIVEATNEGVQLENRFVNVTHLAIGIDPNGLSLAREEPSVAEWINVMLERYAGKRLIVARDKLDHVRGVRQKLLAFELFLNKYPEWRDKVVMIQVATSTADNPDLAATVGDIVTRIDSTHSTLAHQPLVFLRQDIAFSQYIALLSVADALMVTSLREGMNLTCHEYICCQDGKASGKKHGPVILSEFTGSASVFGGNELSVNPWHYRQCAEAIKTALEMDPAEKEDRYNKMREVVMHHTGEYWCTSLAKELEKVHEEHWMRSSMSIPRLPTNKVIEKYCNANNRLFLLDYEGTLASYGNPTNIVLTSPQRVVDTLSDLLVDDRNTVYVMSSRTPEELERLFVRLPYLGLVAENGCFVREADTDEWVTFADMEKTRAWKEGVHGILKYYQERIDGSWIEERHCSLTFHYDQADDQEGATRQAGDCANHINAACESQLVHAVPGNKSVFIEPIDLSKGTAAAYILDTVRHAATPDETNGSTTDDGTTAPSDNTPDFLFVAGDDREDEVVFRWANKLGSSGVLKEVTTVSVGKRGNTEAMATLSQGTTGLLSVLQRLAKA
jgi:trehalose 6-phosphate synthase/phosphatase